MFASNYGRDISDIMVLAHAQLVRVSSVGVVAISVAICMTLVVV